MQMKQVGKIAGGQDGAIWGNLLFRFQNNGGCHVYDLDTLEEIAQFCLDATDVWMPHSNAVMFGCEYFAEGDEFPLLYTNVYNTYAKEENRREGVCCVYRITRNGDSFRGQLVQTITIGFTKDADLWCSEGGDIRPYGNFVIDREKGIYYGFTMRDKAQTTPYFAFKLPTLAQGEQVVLNPEDILFSFDCPYHHFVQGACVHKGMIFSLEGFTNDGKNVPAIRIIDAVKKEQLCYVATAEYGMPHEPEMIDFRGDTCYCSDCDGNLYIIEEIGYV